MVHPAASLRKAPLLALWLALAFAGCTATGPSVRQIAVLGGEVEVRAPQFYCVDLQSSRGGADAAVVLIGRCTAGGQVAAALVTVTVGRSASAGVMLAGPEALRGFLSSPAGRGLLARSGRAEDVRVLDTRLVDGHLMMRLDDRESGDYWRAVIGIKGRLVTISALGPEDAPLSPEDGRDLVERTIAALLAANPGA